MLKLHRLLGEARFHVPIMTKVRKMVNFNGKMYTDFPLLWRRWYMQNKGLIEMNTSPGPVKHPGLMGSPCPPPALI